MPEVLKDLYESGKCQEVIDQFTQKEGQNEWATLSEEEQITCIYYKCRALEGVGRYEEALQTATMARTTYPSPKNPSYLLALLAAQFFVLFWLGQSRFDKGQSILVEGEATLETLTDEERQTGAFWIAVFEQVKGFGFTVKQMSINQFYDFLFHKYFKWKYTAPNRYATTAKCLKQYQSGKMDELGRIKDKLFKFDINNIRRGLEIATTIRGLGPAGASGLLSLLFPCGISSETKENVRNFHLLFSLKKQIYQQGEKMTFITKITNRNLNFFG
jgi:hypothetical protein